MFRAHAGNVPISRSTTTPYARYFEMPLGRAPVTKREVKPKAEDDTTEGQQE